MGHQCALAGSFQFKLVKLFQRFADEGDGMMSIAGWTGCVEQFNQEIQHKIFVNLRKL